MIAKRCKSHRVNGATPHLLALGVVGADVRELPPHVEQHVVLPRRAVLHEIGGEHPRPEHDAVVLEAACGNIDARKILSDFCIYIYLKKSIIF